MKKSQYQQIPQQWPSWLSEEQIQHLIKRRCKQLMQDGEIKEIWEDYYNKKVLQMEEKYNSKVLKIEEQMRALSDENKALKIQNQQLRDLVGIYREELRYS